MVDYALNKTMITKNFCENKAKPKMHCNGKCHLKKQLEKDDKQQSLPSSLKEKSEIEFFSAPLLSEFDQAISEITRPCFYYLLPPVVSHNNAVFHPPTV